MAGLEPGPLWFQVICDPIKSFDGWLGIYETKPQAKQAADLAKGTSPLIKKIRIETVECLPPGDYYIGDVEPILRELISPKTMSGLLKNKGKGGVYSLEDGTIFSIFKTFSGDGVWEDQIGNSYAVDSGIIGAFPRKKLGKQAKKYNYRRLKYPAICKMSEQWNGCIQIGSFYIFTDYFTRPTKDDKNTIDENVYKRRRGIDEILAVLKAILGLQKSESDSDIDSTKGIVSESNAGNYSSQGEVHEGAKVFHESHGEGIIKKVFGEGASATVAVDFKDAGLKILDLRMTKISL